MNVLKSTSQEMFNRIASVLLSLIGLLVMQLTSAYAAEPVKIGVLAFRPKPQTLAQWQPLATALKQAIPERDFVIEVFDYPELDMAVATRQLDFVLTNSGHYVLLTKRSGLSAPLATLSEEMQGKTIAVMGGAIFSRADNAAIRSLADLEGKSIAATSTEAIYGYQAQAYELKQAGIHLPQDAKMLFTGMPLDNVAEAVLAGRADAGFARSGALEEMAREGKLDMAQIKIINRQSLPDFPVQVSTHLYPNWPFAALPHIDENLSRHVAAALFLLEENRAAIKAMGIHGFAIPADYTPVSDMLRDLRMPPFDAVPDFTLHDVWRQYRWWIIIILIAGGLILLLVLRVLIINRKLNVERRITLQQKQQLEESERRYRFLFNNNPMPMWVFAGDSLRFLEVNERAVEHYGFTREEFSRMTLYDLRSVDGVPELERAISSSPGGKILTEARHKKKDGALIDVAINAMPMEYGATPAWITLIQDITGRRAMQRKMANQLAFTEAVINAEMDALSVCHGIAEPPYTRFTVWNPSMENLTGYRLEEINRLGWYQTVYIDSEVQEQARQRMERMRQGEHLRGEEWTITRRNGERRVVQIYTVTVAEDDRGAHVLAVMRDITERKHAEKELREKTQLLDSIVENIPNMIFLKRASDLRFALFNRAGEALVGHSRDELLERNDYDFFPKEQADFFTGKDRATLEQDGIVDIAEEPIETPRGTRILHTRKLALRDEQGQPQYLLGISEDITERKQAETALKRHKTVIDTAKDGFWMYDTSGYLLEVNQAYADMMGYTCEELIGMHISQLSVLLNTPELVKVRMEKIIKQDSSSHFETQHRHKDGHIVHFETSNAFMPESNIVFSFLRDITERKQAEEELKRSNAELEQFSYAVSHDMRQPLRMISSYLQLLERSLAGQLDNEKRDYFNFAIEGAKRIDQMLVALLEYSRVGRMGEQPTIIDSHAVLDEALQFLQPVITEAQAKLNIVGEWPRILVSHDEILRLLQNLIGNAVKYRIAGRIPEITVTSETSKNEWRLCVADNGVGIIPDQIKRLFQVFQRLQSREAYEGTGIGLALCRKIAEHHKGRIWAESEGEGKGSRFCVVLLVPLEKTISAIGETRL